MKYTYGLRGHDIADNFEAMCENAKINHINELQFAMAKTIKDINFFQFGYNPDFSSEIAKKLFEYNLKVAVLGCYINPVNPDKEALDSSLRLFSDFISYARDYNATVIGTETGFNGDVENTWSEANYKFFLENFCPLIKKAEEYGVTIGIEPVRRYTISSPWKMKRMIDDLKTKNLGVILDVANMIAEENREEQHMIIDQSFHLLADRIKVIHLKDFTIKNGHNKYAKIGTGELDIQYLFRKVEEYNIDCHFILDGTDIKYYDESLKTLEQLIKGALI